MHLSYCFGRTRREEFAAPAQMHHEQLDHQGLLILVPWSLNLHLSSVTSAQQLEVERQGGACVKEKCVCYFKKCLKTVGPSFYQQESWTSQRSCGISRQTMIHVYSPAGFLSYSSHLSYKYTVCFGEAAAGVCFSGSLPGTVFVMLAWVLAPTLALRGRAAAKDLSPSQQGWVG